MASSESQPPALSIVIPFYNEQDNINEVCEELASVLGDTVPGGWELLMVNDGSKDDTGAMADALAAKHPNFRSIHIVPNRGQSAALEAGFRLSKGRLIATLDGDGQNDPSDMMMLVKEMDSRGVDMMCGIREKRADNVIRKISSRLANRIRSKVLGDTITDVGCSLRVFKRSIIRNVGFFRNAHRFFPALVQMRGFKVAETPVKHRTRMAGTSKYGGGINSRLWVGIVDLLGVYWLKKRALRYRIREAGRD